MEILCFFAGIVLLYLKTVYPAIFMFFVLFLRTKWRFLIWFLAGTLWALLHQWSVSCSLTKLAEVIPYAKLEGYISSIPIQSSRKVQFQFFTEKIDNKPIHININLSCFNNCPLFRAGEYWQLLAKLKAPKNFENPGGFDYERGLMARHVVRVGYIHKRGNQPIKIKENAFFLLKCRTYLAKKLERINPEEKTLGIIQALTLGVTKHIGKDEWDLFRRTGTTHLMVISGSHISLIASVIYFLAKKLWSRFGALCLYYPAPKVASVIAFLAAFIYSLLAGFDVPAQRALIVCFFMFYRFFCHQRFGPWQACRYALLVVLLFEPHSVLLPGFYLSFLAVAILISVNARLFCKGLQKTVGLQIACAFGLMPLTLFWFSYGSMNGLAANLLAIPWVSFVITPLALILLCCGVWFTIPGLSTCLDHFIQYLMIYLRWIDSFDAINLEFSFEHIFIPMMLMILASMLLFMPVRKLAYITLLLFIHGSMPSREKIEMGEARIRVLDVGQGLSIVVHTAKHTLIYDTGLQYYQGSDMGKMVIIPYLKTMGINKIDYVVISHPDLDHRGGLASLEEKYKIQHLVVDAPHFYHKGQSCHHYAPWQWDGVNFEFFPILSTFKGKNNTSCVLQIKTKHQSVLLTGDIERQAEQYLIKTYGKKLRSSVLVIPHHGSKTSSSSLFVDRVSPQYAVASYGFDNRYHFPHQQTMQIYHNRHIPVMNTQKCGMITIQLKSEESILKPLCYKDEKGLKYKFLSVLNGFNNVLID